MLHSDYCHQNKFCRFGFSKPISTKTIISRKPVDDNNKKEIIQKSKICTAEDSTFYNQVVNWT